jgi:beta-galactosidase GanA
MRVAAFLLASSIDAFAITNHMASRRYDMSRFRLSLPKIGKLARGVTGNTFSSVVHLRGGSATADSQTDVALNWQRSIGVCYYPEHWPRNVWEQDASDMVALGIKYVRIGEFMWSTIQPAPPPPPPASAVYDWSVLDDAIEVLGRHGLKVVLGTPTACPPKWLIDAHPDVLPYDAQETPRKFGSRRHYSFSSPTFREHTAAVCGAMAQRYGEHPAVVGWQLDNEYGCHDTVRTYDPGAQRAFREWLAARYGGSIAALNTAWGSKFWSSEYRSFEEVDLPCGTVTEASPSHRLDFFRFSSDQVPPPLPPALPRPGELMRRPWTRGS